MKTVSYRRTLAACYLGYVTQAISIKNAHAQMHALTHARERVQIKKFKALFPIAGF